MLKMKFGDGSEREILTETTIYPSGSAAVRSRMELHLAGDAMGLEAFEALVNDPEKTGAVRIIETRQAGTGEEEEKGEVLLRDDLYTGYTVVPQVGCRRVETVDHATGAVSGETHLVAVLEQLTWIEQQLAALGIRL